MKKSKFTAEQIAVALRQADLGTPLAEACRKMGVSEATYRYSVSQSVLKGAAGDGPPIARVPAGEIEALVLAQVKVLLQQPEGVTLPVLIEGVAAEREVLWRDFDGLNPPRSDKPRR